MGIKGDRVSTRPSHVGGQILSRRHLLKCPLGKNGIVILTLMTRYLHFSKASSKTCREWVNRLCVSPVVDLQGSGFIPAR